MIPKKGSALHGLREREAMLRLGQHDRGPVGTARLALYDAPDNWVTRSRLVLTDFKRGFTGEDSARSVIEWQQAARQGGGQIH